MLAANSARISTALRSSIEQLFSMKNVWKILKGRIHHAYFRPIGPYLCNIYGNKYQGRTHDLGQDWYDMPLIYVVFANACGLQNWFGSGFKRTSSDPAEQVRLANSLLLRLSLPNVLVDPDLGWGFSVSGNHVSVDPCSLPNSQRGSLSTAQLSGIRTLNLGNVVALEALGIPQIEPGQGKLLREPSGGGDFCLNRGEGLLSVERQRELRDLAESGHYASLRDYMVDAVMLPSSTEIISFTQESMPTGWASKIAENPNFPYWQGQGLIVAMKLPSHFKNNRINANMHKVVLLFCNQDVSHNGFTGTMKRFYASWCSCKMGSRTNSLCAHRSGAMIVLMAPWFFTSKVTPMFKVIDIWRHPNFQPVSTGGVPSGNRERNMLIQASICRPRKSDDRRTVGNRRFDPNYSLVNPRSSSGLNSAHQSQLSVQQQQIPAPQSHLPSIDSATTNSLCYHPSGLGGLLNSNNCCFVNAVVQGLLAVDAHTHINWLNPRMVSEPSYLQMCETLYDICISRGNPAIQPFSASSLRDDINTFLSSLPNSPPGDRFQVGQYECAMEFLQEIISNIDFNNMFVDFLVEAHCPYCGHQVSGTVTHKNMLTLSLLPCRSPVSLSVLFDNRLQERQNPQDQLNCHCTCPATCTGGLGCSTAARLQGHLLQVQGRVLIIGLDRSGLGFGPGQNIKVLTQLREFEDIDGFHLAAVLCHVQRVSVRGHWIGFVRKDIAGQQTWWKLDDCRLLNAVNPFLSQCRASTNPHPDDYTIDVLIFKN